MSHYFQVIQQLYMLHTHHKCSFHQKGSYLCLGCGRGHECAGHKDALNQPDIMLVQDGVFPNMAGLPRLWVYHGQQVRCPCVSAPGDHSLTLPQIHYQNSSSTHAPWSSTYRGKNLHVQKNSAVILNMQHTCIPMGLFLLASKKMNGGRMVKLSAVLQ